MSKAEDRALEKYPLMADDNKEGLEALKYIGIECECASVFNEAQEAKQAYFIEGYHQAEKDNELTWEDIKLIDSIGSQFSFETGEWPYKKEHYEEVLKRFREMKEK